MTKFLTDNQRLFVQAIAAAARGVQPVVSPRVDVPDMPHWQRKAFEDFRQNYHTQWGILPLTFRKAEMSPKTGRPIAYYDLLYTDHATGIRWVRTFRYGWKRGAPYREDEFEWRAENRR